MKLTILIILFTCLNFFPQDESIKKMFDGKWKMDTDKFEMYEEWNLVSDSELKAESYSINDGKKKNQEIVYLKKIGSYWAYIAVPANQSPAMFILKTYEKNKFIFENPEHDFPQKIIYEFHSDDELRATIEGNVNGKFERKEFHFVLSKN